MKKSLAFVAAAAAGSLLFLTGCGTAPHVQSTKDVALALEIAHADYVDAAIAHIDYNSDDYYGFPSEDFVPNPFDDKSVDRNIDSILHSYSSNYAFDTVYRATEDRSGYCLRVTLDLTTPNGDTYGTAPLYASATRENNVLVSNATSHNPSEVCEDLFAGDAAALAKALL